MLSQSTRLTVADLIKTTSETEAQSEVVRQVLCEKSAFQPSTAFKRVSNFASTITSHRLRAFLAENDVNISKQDAHYLVRIFDTNGDGRLSYNEFLSALLTKGDLNLRNEVLSRKGSDLHLDEGLPYQVEHSIARIFEGELEAFKNCEKIRQELASCEDFTIMNAFREVDVQDDGYIDSKKIGVFMDTVDQPLKEAQIEAFMFRVDKTLQGVIRYSEFMEVFYSIDVDYTDEKEPGSPLKRSSQKPSRLEQYSAVSSYSSPKKQTLNTSKVFAIADSYLSPQHSTKMSIAYSPSFKTPTKKTNMSFANEEPDYLQTSHISQSATLRGSFYSASFSSKKESPLKKREENELVKALKEMIDNIRALENMKNNLAQLEDFNVYNSFAIFDVERRGMINSRELEQGLKRFSISVSKGDMGLLMKRLDGDLDGTIQFADWTQAVVPKSAQFARAMTLKNPQYLSTLKDGLEAFQEDTMEAYRSFLKALVEQETLYESIRQRLLNRKNFNLHDAFKALDRYDTGFITAEQFRDLLEENNINFSQKDVSIFIERYSKADKGRVSYSDFILGMTPKSTDRY